MFIKLNESQKQFIAEASALSGVSTDTLRESFEFCLIRWAEKIASAKPNSLIELDVPFLGKVAIKYIKDEVQANGSLKTVVSSFIALDPQFEKLVGDINDDAKTVIDQLLHKKIENAILANSNRDE